MGHDPMISSITPGRAAVCLQCGKQPPDKAKYCVVQEEYFTVRMDKNVRPLNLDKYMWFLEATAVALSGEANDYYVSKGWNKRPDILEDRDYWETFSNPLNDMTGDEMVLRRHGYTASLLLEFLRDDFTFNHNGKRDYIRNDMEAFSGLMVNSISALHTGGGSTEDDLTLKDILAQQYLPIPLTYTISIKVPYVDDPFLFILKEGEQKKTINSDNKTKIGEAIQDAMNEGNAELEISYWENVMFPEQEKPLVGPESKVAKILANNSAKWIGSWIRTAYEDSIIITNPYALVDNPELQKQVEEGREKVIVTNTVTISAYQKDGYEYRIDWTEKRVDTYQNKDSEETKTYLGNPGEISNAIGAKKLIDGLVSEDFDDWEVLYYLDEQTILFRDYEHKR